MDIAFVKACKLILDVQGDPCSSIDCYIDNTPGLTVDIPCSENASRSEAAISLTIKEVTQPDDANKPIPCEAMVAEDKLLAEGRNKSILGWLFNFGTLTVFFPGHKFIAWMAPIQKMITMKHTISKELDTTIGRMGHVGFVIPWVYHFLS